MARIDDVDRIEVAPVNSRQHRSLYKARESIHPMRVAGVFRRLKWWIMGVLLAVYYVTPWLRWDRGEGMPDQAVLIDLEHRRFFFFFIEIWPQEFYYVAGLLIMAGIGLFLLTSVLGRAWCGYACPQTVWVDLYVHVERWLEGDRNARFRLDKAPWGGAKIRKRVTKYLIWLLIAVATGGAWVFYFADAPTLLVKLFTLEASSIAYVTVGVLTATTFVFGGFMREQVCTYMCPWPRIQAAMMDENSLTVTYQDWRGEPRGRHRKSADTSLLGDCIDCNQCVAVCPMGIDIRDGQQLECINCALCIDACNTVMTRTGGKLDLISYTTLKSYEANADGRPTLPLKKTIFRARTLVYAVLWSCIGLAMLFVLFTRDRLDVNVLRDRNPQYVLLSDGDIRNGYTVKILNMEGTERRVLLQLGDLPGGLMNVVGQDEWPSRTKEFILPADKVLQLRVFVTAPVAELSPGANNFRFSVTDLSGIEQAHYGAIFRAPEE
ncbi:MAG: cytochrome c oxidase accessory protein CcoG [Minwuia sp.]|nr:cytochrome c oxidase accessory protein CcoG [Minwuia sp.]